jgi:hypothetical protein
MTLRTRLARLETVGNSTSRIIVINGPKGLDTNKVLGDRGIDASDRDLVVVIADPAGTIETVTVTVDGRVAEREASAVN